MEFFLEFDVCSCMLIKGKLEIFPLWGKLDIKSPGENKRNRGNHGMTIVLFSSTLQKNSKGSKSSSGRLYLLYCNILQCMNRPLVNYTEEIKKNKVKIWAFTGTICFYGIFLTLCTCSATNKILLVQTQVPHDCRTWYGAW